MASKPYETLFEEFRRVSAGLTSTATDFAAFEPSIALMQRTITEQLGALEKSAMNPAALSSSLPTHAVVSSPESAGSQSTVNSSGVGETVLSIASKVFGSGLGLAPLFSGLFGLFGGGGEAAPPPLVKYGMPEHIYFAGANSRSGYSEADYDQMGMPRSYTSTVTGFPSSNVPPNGGVNQNTHTEPSAQIQVNVQAMDARSFLDHSHEIAQAVRSAMLSLNSLNDVVNDL
ncbi:MAG: hypothetical protein C5B51_17220 [Terriglobia bacterium]|nr:MAG: hypothetical protein C5B51_17220 [Terriglobia bacterium]